MPSHVTDHHPRVFLSTAISGRREVKLTQAAAAISALLFLAAVPFATMPLQPVPAFIPAYQSALVVCDLVTAVLLFSQLTVMRSRALYVLACGYLFTAFIAFVHALTFPNVFSPTGLLGAGPQSTAWLYMFWHAGFPLFVIVYALLKGEGALVRPGSTARNQRHEPIGMAIVAGALAIFASVCAITAAVTIGHDAFPVLLLKGHFTPTMNVVVSSIWVICIGALALLWRRRPHTVLDLWLMVVMCAWLFDVALSALFNDSRYDLGWYGGRIYGLLAAALLLIVLLLENRTHYARLAQLSGELSAANAELERLSLQDSLTDLANRRCFDRYLADQIAVAHRHIRPLALVMCDVDGFKAYNDHYGHQAGDACLRQVAAALRSCCRRPADMAARYGGEEFAIILPDTDLAGASVIAEAARDAVAKLKIPHAHSLAGPFVSISGGVANLGAAGMTAQQLITSADRNLFQAKHLGRNRMVSAQAEAA